MNKVNLKNNKGFSLIELLVSIAILVIVSGIVFFNQSGFNNNVLLENLAYEISLTIRQAQSYGLQSKETKIGAISTFEAGYGVYFDLANPDKLVLYLDENEDHIYDLGETEVDSLKITGGSEITKLCAGVDCNVTKLSISFIRPDPTAYISNNNAFLESTGKITITSKKNEEKVISINRLGQISID